MMSMAALLRALLAVGVDLMMEADEPPDVDPVGVATALKSVIFVNFYIFLSFLFKFWLEYNGRPSLL